ncbi:FecR family protein [Parapedobacter soli]|uniref:FecR family protein n=1 Tax=Parapedobacter soli TaxID=416955 RepID=UPI0021C79C36|nr:FecR family protein [Parapedobacter soli]
MQEQEKIRQLFERYRAGRCTPEEQARLHVWFNQYAANEAHGLDDLAERFAAERTEAKRRWLRWFPYVAAAAAILITTLIWNFNDDSAESPESEMVLTPGDIPPGGNRATLTLADGRKIDLSEMQSGIVVGNERILYEEGAEELVDLEAEEIIPLVLSTPKGGTYQITLADGTKVWLNAASTLQYPSRFDGKERVVELEGEAYFAVTKDAARPFRVVSHGQQIEVLGTEFNVAAYADDAEVKTTLVEGRVALQINASGERMFLAPNEQSVLQGATIRKQQVDVGPYIAWKDGNFHFHNTPLSEMMTQMSRWYDIDVAYEKEIPNEMFNGTLSRNVSLRTVLDLLRISEVKYRIEGDRLIIE